jgi:hypothetical protein
MTGEQRRGRSIAMTNEERDEFLRHERVCRLATVGPDGPHVSPLWFVWDGSTVWIYSVVRSQRWRNLERNSRASVVVDAGTEYLELRGVELAGNIELLNVESDHPQQGSGFEEIEKLFGQKYSNGHFKPDDKHAWTRLSPEKVVSWDFRKIATRTT